MYNQNLTSVLIDTGSKIQKITFVSNSINKYTMKNMSCTNRIDF